MRNQRKNFHLDVSLPTPNGSSLHLDRHTRLSPSLLLFFSPPSLLLSLPLSLLLSLSPSLSEVSLIQLLVLANFGYVLILNFRVLNAYGVHFMYSVDYGNTSRNTLFFFMC